MDLVDHLRPRLARSSYEVPRITQRKGDHFRLRLEGGPECLFVQLRHDVVDREGPSGELPDAVHLPLDAFGRLEDGADAT